MKRKIYNEKLKDPRWQKKRLEIFQRDGFMCKECGNEEATLTVHHCFYEKDREPWDYPDKSFITLCQQCHQEEFESQYETERELIKSIRSLGFLNPDLNALASAFDGCKKLLHIPEIIAFTIAWILKNEKIQQEMIDRYFESIKLVKK